MELRAVVEIQLAGNLLETGIEQDILTVKNDDRVNDVLQVPYLVGGYDYRGVLTGVFHQCAPELRL